jgi:hypothetical protein
MKESMVIYRSFFEALKDLPESNRLQVWDAICELGLNGVEVELSGLSKTIFTLIKPQIDANNRRAAAGIENGHKGGEFGKLGGRPPKEKPTNNPQDNPLETPKKPSNVNDNANGNGNDNGNANENDKSNSGVSKETKPKSYKQWTLDDFKQSIADNRLDYPKEMLNSFFSYWSELNISGKPKFTAQSTWETPKRLKRWFDNNSKFTSSKPQQVSFNRSSTEHYK